MNDDSSFCAYCGAGPSKFMLGCCDGCSEELAAEFAAEDDDDRSTWTLSDWDWEHAQREHEKADEAYLWRDDVR